MPKNHNIATDVAPEPEVAYFSPPHTLSSAREGSAPDSVSSDDARGVSPNLKLLALASSKISARIPQALGATQEDFRQDFPQLAADSRAAKFSENVTQHMIMARRESFATLMANDLRRALTSKTAAGQDKKENQEATTASQQPNSPAQPTASGGACGDRRQTDQQYRLHRCGSAQKAVCLQGL